MSDQLTEAAARGVEALNLLVAERDSLREENERTKTRNIVLEQELTYHKQKSAELSVERDHYMRYSTELVARLNNIQVLINDTVKEAGRATYKPQLGAKPSDVTMLKDGEDLQKLIARLPMNGGVSE